MSAKGKKNKKKNIQKSIGDVTLNDFANATVCKNRQKKSSSNVNNQIDERSWEEKIEDFDGDFDLVEEENEDGTKSVVLRKKEPRRRKKTISKNKKRSGMQYPIDIWFLISEHIRPEDIGRFAAICRSSFEVVSSAKFWFNLYKRFYKDVKNLPQRLQPECMVRLYGLRACVIRSLYYCYPPFKKFLPVTNTSHPNDLIKRNCILTWHKKVKSHTMNTWVYYFKLKDMSTEILKHKETSYPDLIEMLEDVRANNEENCKMLRIVCGEFVPLPPVMGLYLVTVSLSLSQNMRNRKLQLGFGSGGSYSKTLDQNGVEINLDTLTELLILDWWDPRYPHSQTRPIINHDNDE